MPSDEKTSTFGVCNFTKTIPTIESLSSETKVLDLIIPFEEALKLNVAVDECIRKLNRDLDYAHQAPPKNEKA